MSDETSKSESLHRDWSLTFTLKIQKYTVSIGSGVPTIQFSCVPERASLQGLQISQGNNKLHNLPVKLFLRGDKLFFDSLKDTDAIGNLKFYDPINTHDGIVNDPAMAEGLIVVATEEFNAILSLLLKQRAPALLALDVKGIESQFTFDTIWDVSKSPNLEIVEFRFILWDQKPDQESLHLTASIARIEERLTQIEKQIQHGVRIRIFD